MIFCTKKDVEREVENRFYARERERILGERIERLEEQLNKMQNEIIVLSGQLNRHLDTGDMLTEVR